MVCARARTRVHVCVCVCLYWEGGGATFDNKFVYVNIVISDVFFFWGGGGRLSERAVCSSEKGRSKTSLLVISIIRGSNDVFRYNLVSV